MRKQLLPLIFILLLLLTAAGCSHSGEPPAVSDTGQTVSVTDTGDGETADTTTSVPDTDPTETEKTDPVTTTVPTTEESDPSGTESTKPQPESSVTETKPTEPVQTEPTEETETSHTTVTEPVQTTEPEETETTESSEPPTLAQADSSEVAALVAKYINQYRSSAATVLPGLTAVATYRANELVTDFSHTDGISACNALRYGEYVDMTLYGMPETSNYYQGYNREAIAKGNWTGTADEIAQRIATGFKNSTKHWAYVGSEEYGYMAVGVVYDPSNSTWFCCVCMSSKDYGG